MSILDDIGAEAGDHLGKSLGEALTALLKDKVIHINVSISKPASDASVTSIMANVSLQDLTK